jgi:hypothetical protein
MTRNKGVDVGHVQVCKQLQCLCELSFLHESWLPLIIILKVIVNIKCIYFNIYIYICKDKYKNGFLFCSQILNTKPTISGDLSPEASDFISRLLVKNARRRLGGGKLDAQGVKRHPFFKVSSFPHHICYLTKLCWF